MYVCMFVCMYVYCYVCGVYVRILYWQKHVEIYEGQGILVIMQVANIARYKNLKGCKD